MTNKQLDYFLKNQEQFEKVRLRILNILYMAAPKKLTVEEIRKEYIKVYNHPALIGNRLRDLRKLGEVTSEWSEDRNRKLWTVSSRWKKR